VVDTNGLPVRLAFTTGEAPRDKDTQVPIADLDLMLHAGSPKEAWVNPGGGHMGRSSEWPDGKIFEKIVAPWIARQVGLAE